MMWSLGLAAAITRDQMYRRQEDMAAAIALAMTTDPLFGKRTHCRTPLALLVPLKQGSQSSK
jgi:hypothetical protein